jgi:hypothetical protein
MEMEMASEVTEVPIDQLSQSDYRKARSEGQTLVEREPEEKHEEDKPKKTGGGFQKKIDRLTKQLAESERQLEAARKTEPAKAAPAPVVDVEPKREDFASDADWMKATAKYIARQELKAEREEQTKKEADEARKAEFDAYNEKAIAAKAKYDDWAEVVGQSITIPPSVHAAVIEMENGPDVAYYLGTHPEFCKELMEMSQSKANGKIWAISEKLAADEGEEEEETEEEVEPEKPKVEAKPEKKKFEPIKPLGGGSTKSSVRLDQLEMKDYKKARQAGRTH